MRIIHVVPALAGLSVTVVLVPITTVVSRRLSRVRRALIKCTDDRVKLVTEVITGKCTSLGYAEVSAVWCAENVLCMSRTSVRQDVLVKEWKEWKYVGLVKNVNHQQGLQQGTVPM